MTRYERIKQEPAPTPKCNIYPVTTQFKVVSNQFPFELGILLFKI